MDGFIEDHAGDQTITWGSHSDSSGESSLAIGPESGNSVYQNFHIIDLIQNY